MNRTAGVPAVLGALATFLLALPLRPLFDDLGWVGPAGLGVLVVLVSGLLLRAWSSSPAVVVTGQTLTAAAYLLWTQLGASVSYGLPTGETAGLVGRLVEDAQQTITRYAAPAPLTEGVEAMLVAIVVLVALAVDLSAATAESPAIAGLPLLSLFLVSTANAGSATHWVWFLLGAALWLAMLAHQVQQDSDRWTTVVPMTPEGAVTERSPAQQGHAALQVGVVAVAAAVLLTGLLPQLPERYVLDGLGRGGSGFGSSGSVRLSTELDLRRSLQDPSTEPVLRYRSDDPTPEPLRVAVVDRVADGRVGDSGASPRQRQDAPVPDPTTALADGVERETRTMTAIDNGVSAPQLPVPAGVTEVDLGGVAYGVSLAGVVSVDQQPRTYGVQTVEASPDEDDFPDTAGVPPSDGPAAARYLQLDAASEGAIEELTDEVVPDGATALETAQAIQAHLRSSEYTYDLELEPKTSDDEDAVLHFLRTRTGYCQQFATTMVLMARSQGISARLAVGFLPGSSRGDDRVVRASDAHAWPELYFDGVGWVRFEPTPGADSASPPPYSLADAQGTDGSTSDGSTTGTSETSGESDRLRPSDETATAAPETGTDGEGSSWWRWPLGLLVGAALVGSVLPLSAVLARRRRRSVAPDDAARVEVEWRELVSRLGDLGVEPPPGATPRQAGQWIGRRLSLDEGDRGRLGHVVGTLERARYAPPGQDLPDLGEDVEALVDHARRSRQRSQQVRSVLWPRDGIRAWRDVGRATARRFPGGR